jgi:hypothetical protein
MAIMRGGADGRDAERAAPGLGACVRAPLRAWCEFCDRSGAARLDDFFGPLAHGLGTLLPVAALSLAGFEPAVALAAAGASALARRRLR